MHLVNVLQNFFGLLYCIAFAKDSDSEFSINYKSKGLWGKQSKHISNSDLLVELYITLLKVN